jgi:biopolymer transport protein ExbD
MNLKSSSKISAEASMSSMTDLVFLMLIFFVILSTLVSPGLPVELPGANSDPVTELASVTITITPDLNYHINDKQVSVTDLPALVKAELEKPNMDKTVKLRVDETVPSGMMVGLLDIAKSEGWKVSIATKPK